MVSKDVVRRVAKDAVANVFHYSGLRRAMAAVRRVQAGGTRIQIVSYHRVVEDFTGELQRSIPGLLISQETFRKHLEEAHRSGYEIASLEHALDVMAGRVRAKRDLFVVTFDDGYRDVYRYAFPILQSMGVPATVYLPSSLIGTDVRFNHDRLFHLIAEAKKRKFQPLYAAMPPAAAVLFDPIFSGKKTASAALDDFIGEYPSRVLTAVIDALEKQLGSGKELLPPQGDIMDWDEVRKMARAGVSMGAHTLDHAVLTLETEAQVDRQLAEPKRVIEAQIAQPVKDFAYCNGWYSELLVKSLVKNGYRSAVTTEDYPNRIGGDPFTLKRKVLWENFSLGASGDYSSCLTACQLDDVFGLLGVNHPVPGKREQREVQASPAFSLAEAGA